MKNFKPTTAKNMSSCLRNHPKYFWAEDVMKERIQDCIVDGVSTGSIAIRLQVCI
jgi:hypothetical protein